MSVHWSDGETIVRLVFVLIDCETKDGALLSQHTQRLQTRRDTTGLCVHSCANDETMDNSRSCQCRCSSLLNLVERETLRADRSRSKHCQ
jgi:hypothetical protein